MVPKKVSKEVEVDDNRLLDIFGSDESLLDIIESMLDKKDKFSLVVGEDLYTHNNSGNLAKLCGMIEKYTDFKVIIIPTQTNTLGVSLQCELDDEVGTKVFGYNTKSDVEISALGDGNLDMPALNQQEGTFVNANKKIINSNVALDFNGYCLNDIANAVLDENNELTINYTSMLPTQSGFKVINFDDLENGFTNMGVDKRGYCLNDIDTQIDLTIGDIDDLTTYNGSVIYRCEPLHQFNKSTAISPWLKADTHLRGSASFAQAAKINTGDKVKVICDGLSIERVFKIDKTIKGTIALYPTFDNGLSADLVSLGYRFKQVKIEKVET